MVKPSGVEDLSSKYKAYNRCYDYDSNDMCYTYSVLNATTRSVSLISFKIDHSIYIVSDDGIYIVGDDGEFIIAD